MSDYHPIYWNMHQFECHSQYYGIMKQFSAVAEFFQLLDGKGYEWTITKEAQYDVTRIGLKFKSIFKRQIPGMHYLESKDFCKKIQEFWQDFALGLKILSIYPEAKIHHNNADGYACTYNNFPLAMGHTVEETIADLGYKKRKQDPSIAKFIQGQYVEANPLAGVDIKEAHSTDKKHQKPKIIRLIQLEDK